MNTDRWDYRRYEDSFQLIDPDAAGWTLFWIGVIAACVFNFGGIFG